MRSYKLGVDVASPIVPTMDPSTHPATRAFEHGILPAQFFDRMPEQVAPDLLGKLLVHADGRVARLVEVEAYAQDDPAAHTFRGETPRNRTMFGPPGHLYVYLSYGIHWCANAVCGPKGYGAGVLLRAAEPLAGIGRMQQARGRTVLRELCSGPGRLAQAFGIDKTADGMALDGSTWLSIVDDGTRVGPVLACPRIGITKAAEHPLRFVVEGSPFLSAKVRR